MLRPLFALLSYAPILALLLMCASPAQAKRVALVIGNNQYESIPDLEKAVNDARALGQTLKDLDVELITATNVSRREMNKKLQEFAAKLGRGDEAIFFFAGHGVQIDGQNFLLPTDIPNAKPDQEAYLRYEAVGVHQVLDIIRRRGSRVAILVLDACRNNPFRRVGTRTLGGTRGLAQMAAPEGTFIMYSAGVGQEALDTTGDNDPHPNSIFTRTLIPFLKSPGLKLTETARRVRRDVQQLAAAASHEQRPAYYDEVTGDFFFTPNRVEAPATSLNTNNNQDEMLWAAVKDSNKISDFKFYLSRFPKGRYSAVAELKVEQLKEKTVAKNTVESEAEPKDKPNITKNSDAGCKKFFPSAGMTLTVGCEEARAPAVAAKTPPPSIRKKSPSITKRTPSSKKKSKRREKSSKSRRKNSRSINKGRKRRAPKVRQARAARPKTVRRRPRRSCNRSNESNHFAGQYNRC